MHTSNPDPPLPREELGAYPLLTALRERRSRRFGLGMKIPGGPLAYQSRHQSVPLSEEEEAALVFAACGITGHAPGTSYFLPVNDLTFMYVNGLLEILNESTGAFILDERNSFRPAGLGRFARSQGGHLEDNPRQGRVATLRQVEQFVTDFVTIEQGMMLQNLGLMAQALGLGGFPNFANHEFAWFQDLGFRMEQMPASRYVGAGWLVSLAMRLLRRDPIVPYPVGLDREGHVLLKPSC